MSNTDKGTPLGLTGACQVSRVDLWKTTEILGMHNGELYQLHVTSPISDKREWRKIPNVTDLQKVYGGNIEGGPDDTHE